MSLALIGLFGAVIGSVAFLLHGWRGAMFAAIGYPAGVVIAGMLA